MRLFPLLLSAALYVSFVLPSMAAASHNSDKAHRSSSLQEFHGLTQNPDHAAQRLATGGGATNTASWVEQLINLLQHEENPECLDRSCGGPGE